MLTSSLPDNWVFSDKEPYAEPLFFDENGRVLRFVLKPGPSIQEHKSPHSPVCSTILARIGLFPGGDGQEQRFGPGSLLIFDTGEPNAIRTDDEELVFAAFLHGVPEAPWPR
jgi:quercetin dioxygenase-like cupin family protein